jgi:hypothetical protein
MSGYVYILSNPSMPGLLKIGRSVNGGQSRAKNMYQTGVPSPFVLEFEMLVDCPEDVEALAHEALQGNRPSRSREFFSVDLMTAKHAVIDCALRQEDYTVCTQEERGIVEDVAYLASKSDDAWPDVRGAIIWLEPEDIAKARNRRLAATRNPLIGMRV